MTANPTLLAMPLAQNGQKNVIPETQATAGNGLFSQSTGFPAETSLPLGAGGVAPSREDFNGLANLLGGVAYYAQKGWIFQFDAGQDYFEGCIVRDTTDGKLYECINDVSAGGSVPSADSINWEAFSTGGGGVPVGFIMPYAGTGLQEGWLDCDGSAVSRTMYPDLFAAIGTTWGAGDGSTTFNLPRSEDLVFQGASATNPVGTYLQAGLPNIEGSAEFRQTTTSNVETGVLVTAQGALAEDYKSGVSYGDISVGHDFVKSDVMSIDASRSSAIYGASATVQPPAACVRYMIKAFDGQTPDSALIDITQYAADLANKATRSLDNLNATGEARFAHVVIDSYYDSTTGDWWRQYADGWIEQGGVTTGGSKLDENNVKTVTYLKPMSAVVYGNASMTLTSGSLSGGAVGGPFVTITNTTMEMTPDATSTSAYGNMYWYVCGMGA